MRWHLQPIPRSRGLACSLGNDAGAGRPWPPDWAKNSCGVGTLKDAAFNGGDTAELASFYAPDARVVPAGGAAVFGAEAIGEFFAGLITSGFRGHKITLEHVEEKGPVAIASGKWQLSRPGEGGTTAEYSGNWVNVLERTAGGGWRVLLHTWN